MVRPWHSINFVASHLADDSILVVLVVVLMALDRFHSSRVQRSQRKSRLSDAHNEDPVTITFFYFLIETFGSCQSAS